MMMVIVVAPETANNAARLVTCPQAGTSTHLRLGSFDVQETPF